MKVITRIIILSFALVIIYSSCDSSDDPIIIPNPITYTLTYNGNGNTGGNAPVDQNNYEPGSSVSVLSNSGLLVREGYSFVSWNTSADGNGTEYYQGDTFNFQNSDVTLYAQWLVNVVFHELNNDNILDINVQSNDWLYATVDFVNGTLSVDVDLDWSNFQFHYQGGGNNYGFLRVSQSFDFFTVVDSNSNVVTIPLGNVIEESVFGSYGTAEISGGFNNWGDVSNVFIAAYITIDGKGHYGYIKVSYNDVAGQLTIHSIAYNRVPEQAIIAGEGE